MGFISQDTLEMHGKFTTIFEFINQCGLIVEETLVYSSPDSTLPGVVCQLNEMTLRL